MALSVAYAKECGVAFSTKRTKIVGDISFSSQDIIVTLARITIAVVPYGSYSLVFYGPYMYQQREQINKTGKINHF
jgi:hypothetical protein